MSHFPWMKLILQFRFSAQAAPSPGAVDSDLARNLGYQVHMTDGSISIGVPPEEINAFMMWRLRKM
jgi:hypothetical protein